MGKRLTTSVKYLLEKKLRWRILRLGNMKIGIKIYLKQFMIEIINQNTLRQFVSLLMHSRET